MRHYKKIKKCRVCNSKDLVEILKLKEHYVCSNFIKSNKEHPMSNIKIPISLMMCEECKLVQLEATTNPELLYKDYFYRSSTTETMKKDLLDVVNKSLEKVDIEPGDVVVDVGCNDATMLKMYPSCMIRVGIDPATNIKREGIENICIIQDYFNKFAIEKKIGKQKARIITSCAMFYDLDNPNKATKEIKSLLKSNGVAVIQVSYLMDTIKDMNFYDITGEHLEYYSLQSIEYLMEKNGLSIFDCDLNAVNGGSIRIYVTHSENKKEKSDNYYHILNEEKKYKLDDVETYKDFDRRIKEITSKILNYILEEKSKGGLVIGLGASTKGNDLIQECNITKEIMSFISERNPIKIGLRTLGTDILLISEEEARKLNPSVLFVLPWNFKQEILSREKDYINNGGKLLFAMPFPYVLDKDGETRL